ncbi:MAG: ABC transporter permease [Pseudomonadota bacterium]
MNRHAVLSAPQRASRKMRAWLASWWQIVLFGAIVVNLALTPSTYSRANRSAIARQIVRATTGNLMWFCVLSALISIVLVRIVVVTAFSYGLSRFAIEMVVRVLVLELIPITAAMFVALRYTLPDSAAIEQMRAAGELEAMQQARVDPIMREFFPRVLASVFSVWMLGAVSCVMTLVLAYLAVYGFTPWAMGSYTRVVGQVFNSAVTLILVLKILFFSLAVSFIPLASSYYDGSRAMPAGLSSLAGGLSGMVRLFSVVLLIEVGSLMGNYY